MESRTSPLHTVHTEMNASFTPFGGWEMPVNFDSITTEHVAVRNEAGIFDVSHMGQIEVSGPDATALCERLLTNKIDSIEHGHAQYSMITDSNGIILDDTVIYHLPEEPSTYLFIPNAGHDEEMYERWVEYRDRWSYQASVENQTEQWAMVAIQGPESPSMVGDVVQVESGDAAEIPHFQIRHGMVDGIDCLIARTGYTGEDGFEILCASEDAEQIWQAFSCQPCGLGARDTLRIEAGFLLSGQDFHPTENPRNPYEAGVGSTVALDTEFVGHDVLATVATEGPSERFVGLELHERGIPRHGYEIVDGETGIGTVTSGTMSPTFRTPVGLGYVPVRYAEPHTTVGIVIRGETKKASIENPGFLQNRR